jgi:translation initiation factor 5B
VQQDLDAVHKRLDVSSRGVYVMASTLGSLEALLDFLKSVNVRAPPASLPRVHADHLWQVPVGGVGIGNIQRRDVMHASAMLERQRESVPPFRLSSRDPADETWSTDTR